MRWDDAVGFVAAMWWLCGRSVADNVL